MININLQIFMKPAVQKKIFTTKQLESIFGNAEDITKLSLVRTSVVQRVFCSTNNDGHHAICMISGIPRRT